MNYANKCRLSLRFGAEVFLDGEKIWLAPVEEFNITEPDGIREKAGAPALELSPQQIKGYLSSLNSSIRDLKKNHGEFSSLSPDSPRMFSGVAKPDAVPLTLSEPECQLPGVCCEKCSVRKTCLLSHTHLNSEVARVMRRPKPIHKGDRLFFQGDDFDTFYLVRSGSFKSTMIDNDGNGQVVGFHFPQDILGYDGLQSGKHVYEVEALETSSICVLPFSALKRISSEYSSALFHRLMGEVAGMAIKESKAVMVLARMHSEQRLASFLLETSKRMAGYGLSDCEFKLSMQRYDIANYLGLAVETVSRLFRRMEDDGIIHAQRHWIQILDMAKLERIKAAEYKFSGVSKTL